MSDKVLTQECNFLRLLEPGDIILADRDFTIAEDIALFGTKLDIPASASSFYQREKSTLSKRG